MIFGVTSAAVLLVSTRIVMVASAATLLTLSRFIKCFLCFLSVLLSLFFCSRHRFDCLICLCLSYSVFWAIKSIVSESAAICTRQNILCSDNGMFSAFFSDAKGADAAADAVCLSFYLSLLFLKEFALSFGGDPVQEVGPDVGMFARLVNALFKYRQLIFALIIVDIKEQIWTDIFGKDLMAFDTAMVNNFLYFGDDARWKDCFD